PPGRAPAASACEPYREIIKEAADRGRNAVAIYQDLVTEHGFAAKYASVRRFVARLRGQQMPEARVVILTEPGQEGQVDYGGGPGGTLSGRRCEACASKASRRPKLTWIAGKPTGPIRASTARPSVRWP